MPGLARQKRRVVVRLLSLHYPNQISDTLAITFARCGTPNLPVYDAMMLSLVAGGLYHAYLAMAFPG